MNSSEMQPNVKASPRLPTPQPEMWTPLKLVRWTKDYFGKKGIESARLEAELLLADVLQCDRISLYTDFEMPVEKDALTQFRGYVKRRAETREPLQYILGHAEFLGLKLNVKPGVLIPRPETEQLAEWAFKTLRTSEKENLRILDLGTGSGCLALGLASELKNATVIATDLSTEALAIAAENAQSTGLQDRVTFLQGDLFDALTTASPELQESGDSATRFDLIVSNPPYIDPALKATLQPEVRDHEPFPALFAEEKGLAILRRIILDAHTWLDSKGLLALEISPEQAPSVQDLLGSQSFQDIQVHKDYQQLDRFVTARRMD